MSEDRDSNVPGDEMAAASVSPALRDVATTVPVRRAAVSAQSDVWQRARREARMHWPRGAAAVELVLLVGAVLIGTTVAQRLGEPRLAWLPGALFVIVTWLGLWSLGLYQPYAESSRHPAKAYAERMLVALGVGGLAAFVTGGASTPNGLFAAVLLAAAVLFGARQILAGVLGTQALQKRIVFLGAGRRAAALSQRLQVRDREPLARSLCVLGFVPLDSDLGAGSGVGPILASSSLSALVREHDLDEIVVAADDNQSSLPMADLIGCRVAGVRVLDLDAFHEREFGKVWLERLLPSWCVYSRTFDTSALRQISKRSFDLVVLLTLLLLTWPLMLLVAAAILAESRGRGPLLYSQQRVGRHGQDFTLYKFRSMHTDAERDGVARWAEAGDARVTTVGRVIRALRLDELPQLWNVMLGEMSIVGPRPERPQFVAGFLDRVPHYGLRHSVRPGLAGWAQLRFPYGASEADTIEKLGYDLYYAKFHSWRFDLAILLETADVVLFGRGAR